MKFKVTLECREDKFRTDFICELDVNSYHQAIKIINQKFTNETHRVVAVLNEDIEK